MGVILRRQDGAWSEMAKMQVPMLYGVGGSRPEDVFAVGENSSILHYKDP